MRQITERAGCYIFLLPPHRLMVHRNSSISQREMQPKKKPSFWNQADTASATASPVGLLQKAAEQKDFCCCHGREGNSPRKNTPRKTRSKLKSIPQRNFLFCNFLNCGHFFDSPKLQDDVLARASKKPRLRSKQKTTTTLVRCLPSSFQPPPPPTRLASAEPKAAAAAAARLQGYQHRGGRELYGGGRGFDSGLQPTPAGPKQGGRRRRRRGEAKNT